MSTGTSRKKEKRSRSSSSEANNSFVKNVTSRVSSLLPSTITKWFGSPSTSSANGSAPTADATDSSTEDESPESPIALQPPSKRMRFTAPSAYNHYSTSEPNNMSANVDTVDASKSYTVVQATPNSITFRREANYVSTPIRLSSDETASDKREKDNSMFKSQLTMSTVGPSVAPKRRSLFDNCPSPSTSSINACAKSSNNTMRDPNQPCFKPSLLGSPFYPGRTMYGGASSSYINRPNIKERKKTIVNESVNNENNTMSQSARRIMDLLENYSSPLSEARRIPHYVRPVKNNSQDTSSIQNTSISANKTQELHVPSIASILRLKQRTRLNDSTAAARLLIASHSSTDYLPYPSSQRDNVADKGPSKMPSKIKSRLTKSKKVDDLESELPVPINLPTAVLQIDQNNLPKFCFGSPPAPSPAVTTLPKLPTFMETKVVEEAKTITKRMETTIRKTESSKNIPFTFANPAKVSTEQIEPTATPPKFSFGSPERSVDKKDKDNKNHSNSCIVGSAKENENKSSSTNLTNRSCNKCSHLEKCSCTEVKKASSDIEKVAKCSVCKFADRQINKDKCHNCEVKNVTKIPVATAKESSKWKCQECWVSNEESAATCVCCGSKNSSKGVPLAVAKPADDASDWKCDDCWIKNKSTAATCVACGGAKPGSAKLGTAKPAMPAKPSDAANDWKCDDCWIKNKSTAVTCVACGGAKPGGAKPGGQPAPVSAFAAPVKAPDSTFKAIMKSQSDKWECPNCLVKNDSDKAKCVCCEIEKPGTKADTAKPSFNFGVNTTFKFGIDPKAQEQEAKKATEVNAVAETKSKVEESETNNNVVPKIPTFTFGIPAKKPEDQSETTKTVSAKTESTTAPKMSFTFGIPSSKTETTTTTTTLPTFGIPSSKSQPTTTLPTFGIPVKVPEPKSQPVVEEKEKLQEVPKVDFANLPTDNSKLASKMFSSPKVPEMPTLSKPENTDKTSFASMFSSPSENKNTLSNSFSLPQPEANASQAVPQMSFTFSAAGNSSGSNLFSSPTQPASNAPLFGAPAEPAPASMFAPAGSAAPAPGSTVSLFQKPASVAAPPSLGSTAPVFSFGTNPQQTSTAQTEKPKFNFSFGSTNKTESVNIFQNSFGATNDKSSINKFSLSSVNTMSPGNGLPGNSLGGSTGMAASNSMTNNILSGGNGMPTGSMGSGMEMQSSPMMGGSMQADNNAPTAPAGGIFGSPVQKENIWSSNSMGSNNLFGNNPTPSSNSQKPAAFTFGASSGFNPSSFTPTFGAATQPNVFGMANAGQNSQPNLFASAGTGQNAPSVFGSPASNAAPAMSMFGSPGPNVAATPSFGVPGASIPSFEAPSLTPAPAPAFNFGAPQPQPTGMFGFGQQSATPQAQSGGVYNFGAAAGAPQVQFAMGSAPSSVAGRRMRRAVRRGTPR